MRRKAKPAKHRCPFTGKRGYATRRHAGMAATNALDQRGTQTRTYKCDCGFWHLTSQLDRP